MHSGIYDYLIVGAGLFGAVFAHQMKKYGKKCLVIDKRKHIGGNTYCENMEGINVHKYGPHIFHTNSKNIWDFVNSFVAFNRFTYSPMASYGGRLYNLPFNMNTFYQVWGVRTPEEVKNKIASQLTSSNLENPGNLEEQAISMVGQDLYEMFIKGYTRKQWGRPCNELPKSIIKRIPLRYTFDNNYFNDLYQGIPIGGYNVLLRGLLEGIEIKLDVDYFSNKSGLDGLADKTVFTGMIDEYFNYQFGKLEYRSLEFKHQIIEKENYQGDAVINYTAYDVPYTRIIEHKHFEFGRQKNTVVTHEFPQEHRKGMEAYYPINDSKNVERYNHYKKKAETEKNLIMGGRLAEYKYYNMDQVIASSLRIAKKELVKDGVVPLV